MTKTASGLIVLRNRLIRLRASAWHISYKLEYAFRVFVVRRRVWIALALIAGCCLSSFYLSRYLQTSLGTAFSSKARFETLTTLIMTVGAALLGATAIAFSFIMFAMQVNVERMPHGLFRKFSGDQCLMSAFALTFFMAIVVPCLSLVPD